MPNMNDLNPRRYEEQNDETISVICPNLVAATSKPLDIGSHIVDNEAPKTLGTGRGVMGNPADVAIKSETKNEVKTEINQAQWPQTSDAPLDLTLKRPVSKSETKNEVKTEINQAQQPQIFDAPLDFTQKRPVSPAYSDISDFNDKSNFDDLGAPHDGGSGQFQKPDHKVQSPKENSLPSGTSGTTTTTATSTTASTPATAPTSGTLTPGAPGAPPAGAQAAAAAAQTAAAITQLTDEQKRIVFEFKQKMAQLPPDQQPAFIAQHKGSLLKQLNFQPTQLQLLRNNHIQLQLSRPQVRTLPPTGAVVQGQQTSQQQQNVIKRIFFAYYIVFRLRATKLLSL